MAKKAKKQEDTNGWLGSYSDMVTLLMTFFVVMLSMSSTDTEKVDAVIQSLRAAGYDSALLIPIENPGDLTDIVTELPGIVSLPEDALTMDTLYEVMSSYVTENGMQSSMTVSRRGELVHIQFNSSVLFEPDRYSMLQGSKPLLTFVGEVLGLYDEKIRAINVGGHTARTGRASSDVSDWRLSGERAATVAIFLEDECGIDRAKMVVIGYGDNYPIADNSTEAGRSQNRRVEIVIVGADTQDNFDIYGVLGGAAQESGDNVPPVVEP